MKKKLLKISQSVLVVALICWLGLAVCTIDPKYPETPPPGYKIVCDGHGYYGAMMPGGVHVIEKGYNGEPFDNYGDAVARAWGQYAWRQLKNLDRPITDWQECK